MEILFFEDKLIFTTFYLLTFVKLNDTIYLNKYFI